MDLFFPSLRKRSIAKGDNSKRHDIFSPTPMTQRTIFEDDSNYRQLLGNQPKFCSIEGEIRFNS